jgi:tRNA U38,U39,U40 pseudouridine synthase TruA
MISSLMYVDIFRVTKRFDCKHFCDARTYLYILPTFAFTPCEQVGECNMLDE